MHKVLIGSMIVVWLFVGCSDEESDEWNVQEPPSDAGPTHDANGGSSDVPGDDTADADTGDDPVDANNGAPDTNGASTDAGLEQCTSNDECGDNQYCQREPGCEESGFCVDLACGEAETTYCDCDGQTQWSPTICITEPYDHLGECDTPPRECLFNSDCDEGADEYCQREPGCDDPGECRPLEEAFEAGCDDFPTTYCNCQGETEVSPDTCITEPYNHTGSCDEDLDPDECMRNEDCPQAGTYCNAPDGCTEPGTCEPIPQEDCLEVITPYCDCDGQSQVSNNSCIYEPILHTGQCQQ